MLTGRPPWVELGSDAKTVLKKIRDTKVPPIFPEGISWEALSFLEVCLRIEPSLRPTCKMLFEHPFVKKENSDYFEREQIKSKITIKLNELFCD